MNRCSCGRRLESGDRFCARCGSAVETAFGQTSTTGAVADAVSSAPVDGDDRSLLLTSETSASSVESHTEVASGFPLRWVAMGAAAVALLMWGLFAWPQAEPEMSAAEPGRGRLDEGRADGASGQGGDDDRSGAATPDAGSGTAGDPETAGAGNDGAAAGVDAAAGGVAAAKGDAAASGRLFADGQTAVGADDGFGAAAEDQPVGPVVGEETGLGVVIGPYDSGGVLKVVALDSGEVFDLAGTTGRPVGMVDTTLITARWGELAAVDLTTDVPDPVTLIEFEDQWTDFVQVDGDTIWTISDTPDEYVMIGLSVEGEQVEEIDLADVPFGFPWYGPVRPAGDELVEGSAGGIYRRTGSAYQRLSTGRIRASGERLVLIEECDDRLRCRASWRNIVTWAELDHPIPTLSAQSQTQVIGDDRWVLHVDWRTGVATLADLETGRTVREMGRLQTFSPGGPASVSSDGRWFADRTGGALVIVDLDSDAEWELDVRARPDDVMLFIELAGTAFAG